MDCKVKNFMRIILKPSTWNVRWTQGSAVEILKELQKDAAAHEAKLKEIYAKRINLRLAGTAWSGGLKYR